MKLEGVVNATAGLVESISGADQLPSPSPTPFTLSYSFVTILVIVVAVVFLLLGVLLYKVYDYCHATAIPTNDDTHRWLTEDNPHKWVDSNYDVTHEDEKKSDLPSAKTKPRSSDSESDPNHKPGKRLHRQSISA